MIKINTCREYTYPIKTEDGDATVTFRFPVKSDISFNKIIAEIRSKYMGEDEEETKINTMFMVHNVLSEMIIGWTGFVIDENGTELEFNDENKAFVWDYICTTDSYTDIIDTYYGNIKKK